MRTGRRFPTAVDTIVVGAGTAGAVVAGRLATSSTLLLEAGPDYGPADSGRWPPDLLDATSSALWSHDWGYTGEFGGQVIHFNRARVVGGCSAHNAGAVVFGSRFDYDGWAAAGNIGWSARELLLLFASAWKQLRVRRVGLDELTPFQRICRDAIVANGIPAVEDFNNLDENAGVAPFPVNIEGVNRINSAFGYVDPVRDRLTVAGDAPVERVLVRDGHAVGVIVRDGQRLAEIGASRVVLSAGAYGSPAILLRSGIGPADELIAIGVKPAMDLPGVGRNLHDQPCLEVDYEGSEELIKQMERHQVETGWRPDEQVIAKFPSAGCRQGFDLHIYPISGRSRTDVSRWGWTLGVACLTPLSRGSVRLTGPGLGDKLLIDHRYLSDPAGYDRARLAEGVERVREVAEVPELRRLLGRETRPGPEVSGRQAIERFLDHAAVHYYHPVGSCKMGPASDPDSVVDCEGRVHGIGGLYVADASLMPSVISGNTNMPTTVIGERIAGSLLGLTQLPASEGVAPPALLPWSGSDSTARCLGLPDGWRSPQNSSVEGPEVRYATSGDVHIAYGVVGDGPMDVVFVSGWVLSNFGVPWEGSALDFYRGMSSFARLILFDKRGIGMSDRAQGIPDLQTRMDDIRAVMDAVGSERAAIMGFSEGGSMSALFAATYPERTAALVLYSTPLSWFRTDEYPWSPTREEILASIQSNEGIRGTEKWCDDALRDLAPTTVDDPATRRWWRRWVQGSASPGAIKAMALMNSEISVCHALAAIQVPTLTLNRTGDEDVPVESMRYAADRIPGASLVELDGTDHGWWVNSTQIVADIEPFLTGLWKRGEWDLVKTNRVLATVMFTDIVDSTAKLAEVGDAAWQELLQAHDALIRRQLVRYSGREVDTTGDGFFASFDGPARAIRCAQAISDGVRELGLHVRAGLHTGECEVVAGKIRGMAVHIGARVAAQAQADEVVVSSTVKDLVAGSGLSFADRGHVELKGVPGEWHLYAVDPALGVLSRRTHDDSDSASG